MIHFKRTALSLFLAIIMVFQYIPANALPASYSVNVTFDINRLLTKQSIVLYIDNKKTKTLEPDAKDLKLTLSQGRHTFKFCTEKDSDISDEFTLNISGDCKYKFTVSYTGLSVISKSRLLEGNRPTTSQSSSKKSSTYNRTVPRATPTPKPTRTPTPEKKEAMVWIPTHGGKKYHSRSGCSGMKNPQKVTISEAKRQGFTPCKKCN